MIQAVMLIALGFLIASLLGIIIAPSLWSRAYRLSRKQLEQALPLSLAEIEASRDQLRATYAVRLRRLETALAATKQKAALQLVDNSRLQMQIAALKDTIADLELKLAERRNAATVLEQTIARRFPEMEQEIALLKAQLAERSHELQDLTNRLGRRDEALNAAQRAVAAHEKELALLHQALEKGGADRGARRLRRPSQWTLEDYRAEYDRLNLELSKLRQQLAQLQDRDAQQVSLIKGELQKLAELILASAAPKAEKPVPENVESTLLKRIPGVEPRRDRPTPWPETLRKGRFDGLREANGVAVKMTKQPGDTAANNAGPAKSVSAPVANAIPAMGIDSANSGVDPKKTSLETEKLSTGLERLALDQLSAAAPEKGDSPKASPLPEPEAKREAGGKAEAEARDTQANQGGGRTLLDRLRVISGEPAKAEKS